MKRVTLCLLGLLPLACDAGFRTEDDVGLGPLRRDGGTGVDPDASNASGDAETRTNGVGYTALAAPLRRVDFSRSGAYATQHCFQPSAYGVPKEAVAAVLHVHLEKAEKTYSTIINVLPRSASAEIGKSTQLFLNRESDSVSNTVTVATRGDEVCVFVNMNFASHPVRGFADVLGYYAPPLSR